MSFKLRKNQENAINISINNDFKSGIHYHATGSGKSWIAMNILNEFHNKYPKKNVLWICERKDVLNQQFSRNILKERNFENILKKFTVLDFSKNKINNWYDSINSSIFWGKPFLCIVNRCFLTTKQKYKLIKQKIHLIIHDECHSIENKTTSEFYKWIEYTSNDTRIIGFSATPEIIKPLDNILTSYHIYDAFKDKVILPPKIVWIKSEENITQNNAIKAIKNEIYKLPYKKIIVWCGMIEECIKMANLWINHFNNFDICIDFNNIDKHKHIKFYDFDHFYRAQRDSILFCAVKHREGSDIPDIDGCIFMDMVENRGDRVFIQCMGRERKDKQGKKKYGLIVDFKAKGTINICNRINKYMKLETIFPWKYYMKRIYIGNKVYFMNYLDMILAHKKEEKKYNTITYTKEDIYDYFIREIPDNDKYKKRLDYEINLILSKNLFDNILRALEILELTKKIPHITRGSCGSSLVCYLLGISHVDPVKYNISFARFLNKYRDNLPDIDFDFPHYLRDEVFLKLFQKWGNKVARISNHNYYHEKSALRESLRANGIRKFISKYEIHKEINSYDKNLQNSIYKTQRDFLGKFRGFSLHCGGIIYFPDGIPPEYILESSNSILPQVSLNKDSVSKNKNFKIDILSSRGLSQLYYCHSLQNINFDKNIGDQKTIDLLCRGDNIGITLAETPLMRKALLLVKPKSIMDLAICLSIIRPAAKNAKKEFEMGKYQSNNLIFDDDIIFIISKLLGCDEEKSDKLRRKYCKNDPECVKILETYISKKNPSMKNRIREILSDLRKYGFCKAHALSYAQLVWQLAYQKAHNPQKFWIATLKNVQSCYRKWVHIYEAKCNLVSVNNKKHKSIYSINKQKKIDQQDTKLNQLKNFGYWNMDNSDFYDGCYYFETDGICVFKGLIASSKILNYKQRTLVLLIGVEKHKYIEVLVSGNFQYDSRKVIIKGKGLETNKLYNTINCKSKDIVFI